MSKTSDRFSTRLTARTVVFASIAAAGLLAGCVATVRVPGPPPPPPPPPPPAYQPPPPAFSASVEAPGVEVQVQEQATEPPPPLPEYVQPPCPEEGFLWTPGYWAFSTAGYYWIPGTWVAPPSVGVLWTPGYWGFVGGVYRFNAGYWGPHVGFYGGVNYGFGYGGVGFGGGHWEGGAYRYNTAVTNVNTTVIHNTYVNNTVVNNVTVNKVSYNGGAGGVARTPTPQERAAASEPHIPPTALQKAHVQEAVRNPQLAAKANGGHPAIAATARPASFTGPGVVGAKGAPPLKPVVPPSHAATPPAHEFNNTAPHADGAPPKNEFKATPKAPPVATTHPLNTAPGHAPNTQLAHPAATNAPPHVSAPPKAVAPPKPAAKPAPKPKPPEKGERP